MNRYENIESIKKQLFNLERINYDDVLKVYRDSGEYEKWLKYHGEESTLRHFNETERNFENQFWLKGQIKVSSLYSVTLDPHPWISKLGCSKINCENHTKKECHDCIDKKELGPTLEKVIKYYNLNVDYSEHKLKIQDIQKSINQNGLSKIFVIIYKNPPYVFDGNSRLISIATMTGMEDTLIDCYLGEPYETN